MLGYDVKCVLVEVVEEMEPRGYSLFEGGMHIFKNYEQPVTLFTGGL